jgi:hypothetical protein
LTPIAITTTPMNHLIKRSGLRAATLNNLLRHTAQFRANPDIEKQPRSGASTIRRIAADDRGTSEPNAPEYDPCADDHGPHRRAASSSDMIKGLRTPRDSGV